MIITNMAIINTTIICMSILFLSLLLAPSATRLELKYKATSSVLGVIALLCTRLGESLPLCEKLKHQMCLLTKSHTNRWLTLLSLSAGRS